MVNQAIRSLDQNIQSPASDSEMEIQMQKKHIRAEDEAIGEELRGKRGLREDLPVSPSRGACPLYIFGRPGVGCVKSDS